MDDSVEQQIESIHHFQAQLVQMQNQIALFKLIHPEWYREVRAAANGIGDAIENLSELEEILRGKL